MEKISHSEAISIVEKWLNKKGWELYLRERRFGDSMYKVDLILKQDGDYLICEVKCTDSDFGKALAQVNNNYNAIRKTKVLSYVKKRIAITRDLYEVWKRNAKVDNMKSEYRDNYDIILLLIDRDGVSEI